jgi:hypothetical protein
VDHLGLDILYVFPLNLGYLLMEFILHTFSLDYILITIHYGTFVNGNTSYIGRNRGAKVMKWLMQIMLFIRLHV